MYQEQSICECQSDETLEISCIDEQLKAEMSRDSENVRSHPIKSVATSVCATQELDAIDHSFEQSLLHWCLRD